jgi:lipoprotein-anchoring transpeptidase ErfK/SrfK
MFRKKTIMMLSVVATLAVPAGAAHAFHPFDQPAGYQEPRWLKNRNAPRPAAAPAVTPKAKAQPLFGAQGGGQSASIWGADDDDDAAPSKPQAQKFPPQLDGGPRPSIAASAPPVVKFPNSYGNGTVVIDTAGKALYYVLSSTTAYRYPISVGRVGFTWTGTEKISRVASWPDWRPPQEMKERQPGLPDVMTGGIRNPLGAKALYLGNSLYRIHGTNDAKTIGQAASSGCFRMHNPHIVHLAGLAGVGTTVKVLNKLPSNIAVAASSGGKG